MFAKVTNQGGGPSVTERPNVLLMLADQLRYDVVDSPTLAHTPTLDALRAEGSWLANHYTPIGICSPARAALFTGRLPHATGVLNNVHGTDAIGRNLDRTLPTLAESLATQGYRTGYVGKWHLGVDDAAGDRGFADVRLSDAELSSARFAGTWKRFTERRPDAVCTRYPPAHPRLAAAHGRMPFPIYSTEAIEESASPAAAVAGATGELLAGYATAREPFFLVASFLEPHWPNVLPEPYVRMYDPAGIPPWPNAADDFVGKPRTLAAGLAHFGVAQFSWADWAPIVAAYLGAVSYQDELLGRVLARLADLGLAERTLVIVSADHGDMAGAHRQFNKGPLMYEEVYHVPFLARLPGVTPAGSVHHGLTSHIDLAPTVRELAGLPADPTAHGDSLLPLFGEPGVPAGWRTSLTCQFHGDEFGLYSQRMLRQDRYKLIYTPNDVRELYDLGADPYELDNLAASPAHASLRTDLEAELYLQMVATDDPLRTWARNTLG